MKKGIRLFAALVATFMLAMTGAKADDAVTNNVILDSATSELGGTTTVTFKEEKDGVNYYSVKIVADENSKTSILSATSDKIFTITPDFNDAGAGTKYEVNSVEQNDTAFSVGTISVDYSTDGGVTWNQLESNDITTTIEAAIKAKVGEKTLEYGVDYRFSVQPGSKASVVEYAYTDNNGDTVKTSISLEYEIIFPVSGNLVVGENDVQQVYYPTLEVALNSVSDEITINNNYTITTGNSVELPEGKRIIIASGVKVTVETGASLTNNASLQVQNGGSIVIEGTGTLDNEDNLTNYGTITSATEIENNGYLYNNNTITGSVFVGEEGELYNDDNGTIVGTLTNDGLVYNYGEIDGDLISDGEVYDAGNITGDIKDSEGNIYHFINVLDSVNGSIYAPYNMSTVGSKVMLLVYEEEGYELSTLKVVYQKDGKTVEVAVNKETLDDYTYYTFEMPDAEVEVSGTFVEIKNPNTVDNISTYYVSGIISLFGLAGLSLYSKKRMN